MFHASRAVRGAAAPLSDAIETARLPQDDVEEVDGLDAGGESDDGNDVHATDATVVQRPTLEAIETSSTAGASLEAAVGLVKVRTTSQLIFF